MEENKYNEIYVNYFLFIFGVNFSVKQVIKVQSLKLKITRIYGWKEW